MSTQQKLDLVSSLLKEIKDEIGNDISKIESKNLAFYCQMVKKIDCEFSGLKTRLKFLNKII